MLSALTALLLFAGCDLPQRSLQAPDTRPQFFASGAYRPNGPGGPLHPCGPTTNHPWAQDCFSGLPLTEAGQTKREAFDPNVDDPLLNCGPGNPARAVNNVQAFEVTFSQETIEMQYEYGVHRTVYFESSLPDRDAPHTDSGYSVARWSGDVLIIETSNLKEGFWLNDGFPYSDQTRLTERYWPSPVAGNVLMDLVIDDPVYYTRPFIATRREYRPAAGESVEPYECVPLPLYQE